MEDSEGFETYQRFRPDQFEGKGRSLEDPTPANSAHPESEKRVPEARLATWFVVVITQVGVQVRELRRPMICAGWPRASLFNRQE
jgi:hypothetical protein